MKRILVPYSVDLMVVKLDTGSVRQGTYAPALLMEGSLSVVGCQLSKPQLPVVGCQLPIASCQLPVVSCQKTVVSCRLLVVRGPLPVVGWQLSRGQGNRRKLLLCSSLQAILLDSILCAELLKLLILHDLPSKVSSIESILCDKVFIFKMILWGGEGGTHGCSALYEYRAHPAIAPAAG